MSRPANRSQLMERLGATQANHVWAWCGVNESERKVYFSIWEDHAFKRDGAARYLMQELHWGKNDDGDYSPARRDQDEKLALVFNEGYEPFGYFIEAKDRTASPREIEKTRTSFILRLELTRLDDGSVIGTPLERIEIR